MVDLVQFPVLEAGIAVVFETDRWLVVRKPASLHSVRSGGHANPSPSLAQWLENERPACARAGRPGEAGLLQRLDFGTSGLVLAAKDREAFEALSATAACGMFLKAYALVCAPAAGGLEGSRPLSAIPDGVDGEAWRAALARADVEALSRLIGAGGAATVASRFRPYGPGSRRVACLAAGADPGVSRAWTEATYATVIESSRGAPDGKLLCAASLRRGFRHQVRAHFAWIGLPLSGDGLYGGPSDGRLRLHAVLLEFPDPESGTVVRLVDPLVAVPPSMG